MVFFKVLRAESKFWQMIGRGTRLCPDLYGPGEDKRNFYVFHLCGNLEFFSQDLPGTQGSLQKSLAERLFEARLGVLTAPPTSDVSARVAAISPTSAAASSPTRAYSSTLPGPSTTELPR